MAKILVIDDEKAIRRSITEILEFENHQIDEAEDGLIGFDKAIKNNYDVILCDIKMPKLDGEELLLKLLKENINSSIIMMSGHGTIDTARNLASVRCIMCETVCHYCLSGSSRNHLRSQTD